ncbi:hypothetical protein KC571_02420 [candidate division WWE3 bacterium]|uniref:Uncharacterized protein n=1 Tax=candidate division WWE3 bacterium TaxID=2053526 RepID=A0A955RQB1_UNCKA|nr:hypothetical protein [candidate division WWE3 bacterium]
MEYPKSDLFPDYALFLLHEFSQQVGIPFEDLLPEVEKAFRNRFVQNPQDRHIKNESGVSWYNAGLRVNELIWLSQNGVDLVALETVSAKTLKPTTVILFTPDTVFVGTHLLSGKSGRFNHYRITAVERETFFEKYLPEPSGMMVVQALKGVTRLATQTEGSVNQMINDMLKFSLGQMPPDEEDLSEPGTCPFCHHELERPSGMFWAGSCPECQTFFWISEGSLVFEEIGSMSFLAEEIGRLLYLPDSQLRRLDFMTTFIKALSEAGDLVVRDDWIFLRWLPEMFDENDKAKVVAFYLAKRSG